MAAHYPISVAAATVIGLALREIFPVFAFDVPDWAIWVAVVSVGVAGLAAAQLFGLQVRRVGWPAMATSILAWACPAIWLAVGVLAAALSWTELSRRFIVVGATATEFEVKPEAWRPVAIFVGAYVIAGVIVALSAYALDSRASWLYQRAVRRHAAELRRQRYLAHEAMLREAAERLDRDRRRLTETRRQRATVAEPSAEGPFGTVQNGES